jgi:uncharacterized protein DUF6916
MSTNMTEEEFSKHVGTEFQTALGEREISLTLTEVKAYMPGDNEEAGMERFSVFFGGPPDLLLPQQTYSLRHDLMGEFEVFLGAISGAGKGIRYEAVFNYYKE